MNKKNYKQYFATGITLLLVLFLLYAVYSLISGFFGALLLFVILSPLYNFMVKHNFNKKIAAGISIFIGLFVIVVPLAIVLGIIGNEIFIVLKDTTFLEKLINTINENIGKFFPFLNKEVLSTQFTNISSSIASLFLNIISNAGRFIINLFFALFLLYFMLIKGSLFKRIEKIMPFNKKNSHKLINKLKDISHSTVFVGGIVALIQGGLMTTAFLIFGIKGAFLWGFITAILSFFPIIGPSLVWIPTSIIQLVQNDYWAAGGVLIFGVVLSNIDNIIRPILGRSISRIHPLVTLIGIFVGIPLFGIIGLFVGPLLLAFSVLTLKIFKEEYIS